MEIMKSPASLLAGLLMIARVSRPAKGVQLPDEDADGRRTAG